MQGNAIKTNKEKMKQQLDELGKNTQGKFKDVLFYRDEVLKHVKCKYKPGE